MPCTVCGPVHRGQRIYLPRVPIHRARAKGHRGIERRPVQLDHEFRDDSAPKLDVDRWSVDNVASSSRQKRTLFPIFESVHTSGQLARYRSPECGNCSRSIGIDTCGLDELRFRQGSARGVAIGKHLADYRVCRRATDTSNQSTTGHVARLEQPQEHAVWYARKRLTCLETWVRASP